ncbi:SART-1 family protein DOT2-like isoform X1 [Vitis riparia]|uniref:SART-1 family protein DOT2-like isoform X1 n=1 Tax=Vitis riparia TaxID=96939 RepID=UPI00155AA7CC|nr:SART-1 family protein DOT2-like isoform X1 [Vitis riparia]
MDMDWSEPKPERSDELRDRDDSPTRDYHDGAYDDLEETGIEKSSKHRSKDRKKSRREEKDHRGKDRERSKAGDGLKEREKETKDLEKDRVTSRERRKEDRDEREKDRNRDKVREKDYDREKYRDKERERDKDRKDRGKEKEREREREVDKESDRGRDKERGKEKNRDRDKEREKERDRAKDRDREKEKEKSKDREKERENDKDRDRDAIDKEKGKERIRDKEREADQDRDRYKDRDKGSRKNRDEGHDRSKDGGKDDRLKLDGGDNRDRDVTKQGRGSHHDEDDSRAIEHEKNAEGASGPQSSTAGLQERILRMKEERVKRQSEGSSEVLAWVNRSRKVEEQRNAEKEKALQLSKIFEEQDNIDQGESDDEKPIRHSSQDLAGVKVLHGLDKVIDGGAVVLTLKDQDILANGDINEDVDMLENVEIGEQKRRDEAYKAAKKKTGIYEDKFNDEPGSEKKILPQYDDPVTDEGLALDASGRFTGEAEKKLEELRRRLQGVSTNNRFEDLNSYGKNSSDYYTHEEMLQFKKPKKKKSLRKKEKLNIDALEAEAVSAGLGVGDLGSRNDGKRQSIREEQERSEAEMRNSAYQLAYAKADEASKALRLDQTLPVQLEENENQVFGEDDEELQKSLQRARKLVLQKQDEAATSGPQAIALLASTTTSGQNVDNQNPISGESQESRVVFTEMEEFVWGLQLEDEAHKPDGEDVFMDEDEAPKASDQERKDEAGGWTEVKDTDKDELPVNENKEEMVPDDTIHEMAVGKGLSGALQLLKERGTLKEGIEWGGRNMDKKKSKLVGIYDNTGTKEIRIERTDEFGRIMTPKEAFRMISHKFHGKGPGKMKQEKRMKQYQEELKLKQMKNSDTPSQSVERMREAQARLKTPYLVLSGHVKPGQTSDPRSGFATVEKDVPGSLTPMLGDRKVEHFLGIKRKAEPSNMGPPKRPKT